MVSRNTAATGRRRYGLGNSYAPTRGTVNPSGYIRRELAKTGRLSQPVQGADRFGGVSNRRSGLAAAALSRIPAPRPAVKPKPVYNGPKAGFHAPKFGQGKGGGKGPQSYAGWGMPKGKGGKKGGGSAPTAPGAPAPAVGPNPTLAAPTIPTVNIGANGRLDLPFDMSYGLGLLEQQQAMDSELLSLQQEEQQYLQDLASTRRDLDLDYTNVKRDTLNNNAARGMAYSSGYANDVSQNATLYNNFVNDLNADEASTKTGFLNARTGIQNAMQDFIRQSILQQAAGLAEEGAGDLGYGVTEGPAPSYGKPKKIGGGGNKPNKPNKPSPPKKPAAKKPEPPKPFSNRPAPPKKKAGK